MRGPVTLSTALVVLSCAVVADAWQVHRLHPFVEATADQLPQQLGPIARQLTLSGLQNDWIHEGLAISAAGQDPATVTLSLTGSEHLREHVRMRVVGFVEQKDLGYVLDPIFEDPKVLKLERFKGYMRNFESIYEFPRVTATRRDPVAIWITADTRGMAPGRYTGSILAEGADGKTAETALSLLVKPYELPEENPLVTFGWQWIPAAPTKVDGARLLLEYGINACHVDMEPAREAGFKFFIFTFRPSWRNASVEQAEEAEVDKAIADIRATIERLKLQPHQWALYTKDEPSDATVPAQVEWCKYIKQKWPEARFLYNPAWGGDPHDPNVTIEGTIRPLLDCADIWLPYSWWVTTSVRKGGLALMKSTGKPVWFYEILSHKYARRPTVGRDMLRTLAWIAWRHRLQGASWYSLNACDWPWSNDPKNSGHGCIYGTIPGRGLEALRQGIQEYKRLHELRRLAVDEAVLDGFADRALTARHVGDIDRVRREMDDLLLDRAAPD